MYFRRPSRLEALRPRRAEVARHDRNLPTADDVRVKPSATYCIPPVARRRLVWPSDLCELSFSDCDNRKSHPRVMEENADYAGSCSTADGFMLVMWVAIKGGLSLLRPLRTDWQRHVLASSRRKRHPSTLSRTSEQKET
jgi:hypothetical protein